MPETTPKMTITHEELAEAMVSMHWGMSTLKADRIFQKVRELRGDGPATTVSDDETFTLHELKAALNRLRYTFPHNQAERLVSDILEHRQPEFEPGDIVRSDIGKLYALERVSLVRRWRDLADRALVSYDYPARPLAKIGRVI